jgi:hypothetical protein
MIIKICGLTNLDDALAAADLGADVLGFNFYPKSPRCIAERDCGNIVAVVRARFPALSYTGVFVNHPAEAIARIVERCGLSAAQLSGDEPPGALNSLAASKVSAFKAVRRLCFWMRPLPTFTVEPDTPRIGIGRRLSLRATRSSSPAGSRRKTSAMRSGKLGHGEWIRPREWNLPRGKKTAIESTPLWPPPAAPEAKSS